MGKVCEQVVATVLIASRWLMAPLYLGLIAALVVVIAEFFTELVGVAGSIGKLHSSEMILAVLKLVDLVLLANLLLIMLFAGILTLGVNILVENHPNWSRFMGEVDFAGLKLKVVASLTAIAAVGLLESFVDIEQASKTDVMWEIAILLAFVVSGVMLAWMDLLVARRQE
ncbi:MAG TPA: YqhA family protein [Stellaceae bacterium]|nr:YqhA family protein [Stellaceae bacterium]